MNVLVAHAEVDGRRADVRVRDGRVVSVAPRLSPRDGELVVDARGGALLPGLHDHHVHLLATAAAHASVQCGPPEVTDRDSLEAALRTAAPSTAWVRGVGYVETVAGALDRRLLDRMVPDRPVRVQHRSGALWVLNTAGLAATELFDVDDPDVERDAAGEPTGRLWRYDARLRARLDVDPPPDLAALSGRLLDVGVTGVTDATPDLDAGALDLLTGAVRTGRLVQDLLLLGAPDDAALPPGVRAGPRKLLLRDHDLPSLDELTTAVAQSHAAGRAVAVHCVTAESLLLTVLALEAAGAIPGDRVEHAAVVPPGIAARIAALGARVVTQPSLVAMRGDDYLREVDPRDHELLYPYASLLAGGVRVAPSSDAPYGDLDPWRSMAAAHRRRAPSGVSVGAAEAVDVRRALGGFLSPLDAPGDPPRRVEPGAGADLCLLDAPLHDVLREPDARHVRLVVRAGAIVRGG